MERLNKKVTQYTGQARIQNILVAEDEDSVRELIKVVLKQEGYVVWEACNGKEASQILGQCVPDLFITDLVMTGKRGFGFDPGGTQSLPRDAHYCHIGCADRSTRRRLKMAGSSGADFLLAKPFSPGELLGLVKEAL